MANAAPLAHTAACPACTGYACASLLHLQHVLRGAALQPGEAGAADGAGHHAPREEDYEEVEEVTSHPGEPHRLANRMGGGALQAGV
jgi:hypothetical protein